ncbi:armadillo-type protein [Lactifluus volemus]|nr:armadillo-type protein [Lactifluus volemus]
MQVPFISSGALSRVHYSLVRKVELAQTTQQADGYLLDQVVAVRERLSRPGFSSVGSALLLSRKGFSLNIPDCLVPVSRMSYPFAILFLSAVAGLPPGALEFALPHAVNLAEAGASIEERRTGYLFCSEMMPSNHDLRLMLVNTLRKDIEAESVARVTLALNYLIQCPSEDVIPAIQPRLRTLLSHKLPHIRRRALYAIRALAECDSGILRWLSPDVSRFLRDKDQAVRGSAVVICSSLHKNGLLGSDGLANVYQVLHHVGKSSTESTAAALVVRKVLQLYSIVHPTTEMLKTIVGLLKRSIETVKAHGVGSRTRDASSLCPDPEIRLKTLRVVSGVDLSIVQQYYSQRLQGLDRSAESYEDEVLALLEAVKILAVEDAEFYARSVRDVLSPAGAVPSGQQSSQVLERAVENVLSSFRDGDTTFYEHVATTLLTPLAEVEAETAFSPTLMVVLTALACEYAGRVSVSPLQLLCGLSKRLLSYSAECQKVPPEPISNVQHLKAVSGRHISRRCIQFEDLVGKPEDLRAAVANSRSRSLPDFLLALESKPPPPLPRSPGPSPSSPVASRSPISGSQKLRYTAYDPPPPARPRRSHTASSRQSTTSLDSGDDLTRTVTAGDLAIAAGSPEIRALSPQPHTVSSRPSPAHKPETTHLLSPQVDLISLDTPFIAEPEPGDASTSQPSDQDQDFANVWETVSAFSARGWCDGTPDVVVRSIQSLGLPRGLAILPTDQPPFQGELKILILGSADGRGRAALRLHENSDNGEDGCLWRMRSDDEGVLAIVKQILAA